MNYKLQINNKGFSVVRLLFADTKRSCNGFSVVEVILAAALFVIISAGVVGVVLQGLQGNLTGKEQTVATQYATEGLEAMRSIRNQNFALLVNYVGTGIVKSAGVWTLSGSNNIFDQYTRVLKVEDVRRDGSGNIVAAGGTIDTRTKKVTSTVSWNVSGTRNNSVEQSIYLTDWKKGILGDWTAPSQQAQVDLSGSNDGIDIAVSGNYVYLIRTGASPNFIVFNVSNPASPTQVGSLTLAGNPTSIMISGNYAYVSSTNNTTELQVVNIATPSSPSLAGNYNATGNADGMYVYVVGNTAYLSRLNSGDREYFILNVSNPGLISLTGSRDLNGNINSLYVLGTYAFAASSDNNSEFQIINNTIPASPTLGSVLNLSGNSDALSISGFTNTVVIGRSGGDFSTINVTTIGSPAVLNTFNTQGNVADIVLTNNNTYAFLATAWGSGEFRALDISNLSAISSLSVLNLNNSLTGIAYDPTLDRVFASSSSNSQEFMIIQPN